MPLIWLFFGVRKNLSVLPYSAYGSKNRFKFLVYYPIILHNLRSSRGEKCLTNTHYFSACVIFLQYNYMKLLAWAFSSILLCSGVAAFGAPVYRAGEKVPSARSIWHGEVSAGYVLSSHQLENKVDGDKTSRLHGGEVRALWAPLSWLAVGAEMNRLGNEKLAPFVKEYKVGRVAGIVKFTLSPDTTPRFYLLAGLGKSEHKLTYDRSLPIYGKSVEKDFSFWTVGLGIEANVWKFVFVGAEGTLTHYNKTQLTEFYVLSSKMETALHLRAGVRF